MSADWNKINLSKGIQTSGILLLLIFNSLFTSAGMVEKTFIFSHYQIESKGDYQTVGFSHTVLSGIPGEPMLPWHEVSLMLPPGESAGSIDLILENETAIPGSFLLFPQQHVRPTSADSTAEFLRNEQLYLKDEDYPVKSSGKLMTQYLNGHAFALCTFTPVKYNPAKRKLVYFGKVTVRIHTHTDPGSLAALNNLATKENQKSRLRTFAMNPEMVQQYPQRKAPATNYDYLIIAPLAFKYEFQPLINFYEAKGIAVRVAITDSIFANGPGLDDKEKLRNFIISQYQNCGIDYVLLAGNPPLIPARGFYCLVMSDTIPYSDSNIPADLYYSGMDGNYDLNANHVYGEIADDPDLLPEISVGRFTVNDTAELHRMIRKTLSYQINPVWGEFNKPLLAGEHLWSSPMTFGSSYMNLLVNDHADNGYFTHGIPSVENTIEKLYDSLTPLSNIWRWNTTMLLASINSGKSFIHHLGHANTTYMLRFSMSQITNANFYAVNGVSHNYQLLYTQGCYDGAFDASGGCIAAKAVTIDNFLVAGVFNSRYGWFNQGTTDGPSQHLQREFVSALYHDTLPEKHLGSAHMISKIKTAPWVTLQGVTMPPEFEPGAQRWCHYCCNVFGDPALEVWTGEPTSFVEVTWTGAVDTDWKKPGNWSHGFVPGSACNVTIPGNLPNPVISITGTAFCHDLTIQGGGGLTIGAGKSIFVYGTVTLNEE